MAPRPITPEETAQVDELVARGRAALREFEGATQAEVDRLCQAVAWAVANETTFTRLARDGRRGERHRRPGEPVGKRFKVMGILRDVLRQPSVGVIEELPEQGHRQVREAGRPDRLPRPDDEPRAHAAGRRACSRIKCRDAVIFSPHPRSRRTTRETVEIMRRALAREGAPEDLLQCLERPSIPAAQYLMTPGRPRPGDRRPGHGQGGLQLGHAGLRRRCRQLDDGHRRDRRRRRGRAQHPAEQDVRLRVRLLGRRQPDRRGVDLRRAPRRAGRGGRARDQPGRGRGAAGDLLGCRRPSDRATRSRSPRRRSRPSAGFAIAPDRRFFIVEQTRDRAAQRRSARRSSAWCSRCSATPASTRRWTWCRADLRGRRQGPLVRHLLVRRRPHRPPRHGSRR